MNQNELIYKMPKSVSKFKMFIIKLFGKRIISQEDGCIVTSYLYKGCLYVTNTQYSEELLKYINKAYSKLPDMKC